MKIIDMHCDTIRECFLRNEGIRENSLCVDLERMKKNNATAQFFAIWLSEPKESKIKSEKKLYDRFFEIADFYEDELKKNSDIIEKALSYDDIEKNIRAGKMSAILTVEDGQLIEGDLRNFTGEESGSLLSHGITRTVSVFPTATRRKTT